MIVILLSWLVLFAFFLVNGIAFDALLKVNSGNPFLTILTGMVAQTLLLTVCAFFIPIGLELFIGNGIFTGLLAFFHRKKINVGLNVFWEELLAVSSTGKALLIITLLSALLKCAQSPFILDNESYYVQTIKWLNEYGFVKGLGNLNITFGLTSPWHILQSGFNFSFLSSRINDINGFLICICSFFFISKFEKALREKLGLNFAGFIVVFNVLLFQFINAPSPDLPLILIGQVIFFLFLKDELLSPERTIITLLTVFLIFIKITITPLALLLIFILYKHKKSLLFLSGSGFVFCILWISKNIILTGYPLFPFHFLRLETAWTVPEDLVVFINKMVKDHEFIGIRDFATLNLLQKFKIWIQFGGINSIFNKGILVLFALTPFTMKFRLQASYKILYGVLLLHFVIVFVTSPQFRFFLPEFVFLTAWLMADIAERIRLNPKIVKRAFLIVVTMPLIIPFLTFKSLTSNKLNQEPEQPKWSHIYRPELNSKYGYTRFTKVKMGNLEYFSPEGDFFFYGTADGPLPCTNSNIIDLFKSKYHVIPQKIGSDLNDGFCSKNFEP